MGVIEDVSRLGYYPLPLGSFETSGTTSPNLRFTTQHTGLTSLFWHSEDRASWFILI